MIHISRAYEASENLRIVVDNLVLQLTGKHGPTLAELEKIIASPCSMLLVARFPDENSPIVGMATLALVNVPSGQHARLEDVVVDQSMRGNGIGAALTQETIRLAKEAGANYLALTSNPRREAANRLYRRLGFMPHHTNVYKMDL
jgi:GNAT superfamily N-acetyltransferase